MPVNQLRDRTKPAAHGFTLIEVMVALVVLSVGLLGLAGMQLSGLRYNYGAYSRSQATLLAYDIIDRMRANPDGAANGDYNAIDTAAAPSSSPTCATNAAGCTTTQIAVLDHYEWSQLFNATPPILPNASATVVNNAGTFTVTVTWQEREASTAGTSNKILTVNVQL